GRGGLVRLGATPKSDRFVADRHGHARRTDGPGAGQAVTGATAGSEGHLRQRLQPGFGRNHFPAARRSHLPAETVSSTKTGPDHPPEPGSTMSADAALRKSTSSIA